MKRIISVAALLGLFCISAVAGPIGIPVQFNSHWYQAVVQTSTWAEAVSGATALGGYLVSISTEAENTFVFNLVKDVDALWWTDTFNLGNTHGPRLGAVDTNKNFNWSWADGTALTFANWYPGEPNNMGVEDSTEFFNSQSRTRASTWNNLGKTNVNQYTLSLGYVVEFATEPVPEPATLLLLAPALGLLVWRRRRA